MIKSSDCYGGKSEETAKRRERVAELRLEGWTQTAIAREMGTCQSVISSDLEIIRNEWKARYAESFDTFRMKECIRLDKVQKEAWEAWGKSKDKSKTVRSVKRADGETVILAVTENCGDPRFLNTVISAIKEQCNVVGIKAADGMLPSGDSELDSIPIDERRRLAYEFMRNTVGMVSDSN